MNTKIIVMLVISFAVIFVVMWLMRQGIIDKQGKIAVKKKE